MSQNQRILAHLKRGESITPLQAFSKYGCFRLGARIFDLKRKGHNIRTELVQVSPRKRWAKYWLKNVGA